MRSRILFLALLAISLHPQLLARGKNKIPYEKFDWKIYESTHFKFYYYPAEEHLLEQVVNMSESAYQVVSEKLQHELNFPVPMVFYKTHEEFEQTNIFPGLFATCGRRLCRPVPEPHGPAD